MEQVYWWWNGRWGRLSRQDIKVHKQGEVWHLEARQGGVEGKTRWWDNLTEESALELARDLAEEDLTDWRVMH